MNVQVKGMAPLLQVFDMQRSVGFYRDVLGFKLVSTSQPGPDFYWALLERDGVELMLNTAYDEGKRPPNPDPKRVAAHDDTCLYFSCPNVDGMYAQLSAKNVKLSPPSVAPYGMKQLYLRDPDGFGICFQWAANQS
jgi:glyoxylase I family protein